MEGIGSEVSHKIRAAIKAKLIELGAYVDDELPDYIMVMVANKRTRAQMDEDLQLFLSSNTKIFTSWLHTVLQKLQEVTVASFENKKDSESKKPSKRKKSEAEDGGSRKSSEEPAEKAKKHSRKHKESKKTKKSKHKSKDKSKNRKSEKEDKPEKEDEVKASQEKNKSEDFNEAVGRAILGNLKKNKKVNSSSQSSFSSEVESRLDGKSAKENENGTVIDSSEKNKKEVVEDEFNIEPLKPTEKDSEVGVNKNEEPKGSIGSKETEASVQIEKTISAPTKELLKEHDKIQNERFEEKQRKPNSESDESLSPEEIRKQLLLSRAKKKLEESKKAERMRSNSPDVQIVEGRSGLGGRQKDLLLTSGKKAEAHSPRSTRSESSRMGSHKRSLKSDRSSERSPSGKGDMESKLKTTGGKSSNENRRKTNLLKSERTSPTSGEKDGEKRSGAGGEKKKNVIKISESLQMEKNADVKKNTDTKSKEKETPRKRPVSSRVVTITGPEAPEIPSIVKVKPREFISKDKQANKALILKAVADAEKSIATVHTRRETEIEPEPKKEALYTKNLREKRYEKLAITLSNIRRSPNYRLERRISVDSEKSDRKRDNSVVSDGVRNKSDLWSKKISRSEDQFISSKTTVMEKNDKYIRCWLEGVEKAVKDDEMVNPSEMEDFIHLNLTDEENDLDEDEGKRKRKFTGPSVDISSKALKVSDKEIGSLRVLPNEGSKEGPQIVVTLDGLDSKAIKDLIIKNKDATGKPLLTKTNERTSGIPGGKLPSRKLNFEKISDRFGRLNRVSEDEPTRGEKKSLKLQSSEPEKNVATESKNRQLIAQLSEKFGKVDREFESRKRKRPNEDRRYSYESRRNDKEDNDRNGRYRKSERRSFREGGFGFYRRS